MFWPELRVLFACISAFERTFTFVFACIYALTASQDPVTILVPGVTDHGATVPVYHLAIERVSFPLHMISRGFG